MIKSRKYIRGRVIGIYIRACTYSARGVINVIPDAELLGHVQPCLHLIVTPTRMACHAIVLIAPSQYVPIRARLISPLEPSVL